MSNHEYQGEEAYDPEIHAQQLAEDNYTIQEALAKAISIPHEEGIVIPKREEVARIDFETRLVGEGNYLRSAGAFNYSLHPNCLILCLAYRLPGQTTKFWYNSSAFRYKLKPMDIPKDLFDYIEAGGLVEAHNIFFERCIWTNIAIPKLGWPELPVSQMRCSQAKAAMHSIPADLENASKVMNADERKNEDGKKLMLLMTASYQFDNLDNIKKLIAYCIQDVNTECSFGDMLEDLNPTELKVWQEDQRLNWDGVSIDMPMVNKAIKHIEYYTNYINSQLEQLINVPRTTMRARIKDWFALSGNAIDNTTADYIRDLLANPPSGFGPIHIKVLELMQTNNLTSIKKYSKIVNFICSDGKIRSNFGYHGGHTGRFTSYGVQLHNFPRETVKNIDTVAELIVKESPARFVQLTEGHGGAAKILSKALRGVVVPSTRDHKLIISDYAAIEARVLFWLAKASEALEVLASGEDIYCALASRIYRTTITKANPTERQMGKQSILGLGYGMGAITFLATLRKYAISFTKQECQEIVGRDFVHYYQTVIERFKDQPIEDRPELALCQFVVDIYRNTYPEVVDYWKSLESQALRAQGVFRYKKPFMRSVLPSGRVMFYPYPSRMDTLTPWGTPTKEFTCYLPHSGKFSKQYFYGGKLTENRVQAVARDLLCEAMLNIAETEKYTTLLHKHDELVCEAIDPNVNEFDKLMLAMPDWAKGCPLAVETHISNRWQKF